MAVTSEERFGAIGTGLATVAHDGTVLDAWFVSSRLTAQSFHFRTTSKRCVVPNCKSIMLVGTSRR
jgi:hypothetical protein